jgi:hypothetical protein
VQSASSLSTKLDVEAPLMTVDGKRAGCRRLVAVAAAADEPASTTTVRPTAKTVRAIPLSRAITMTKRQTRLVSL